MTRVDLITGFLGAGKTTFIHRYLDHLNRNDQKIIIIENEFGSVSVDTSFLRDEDCEIEDLAGVCMCCTGRGKFISMLISAAAQGYDRVLVEPSGIYDVDEFFSVMNEPAVQKCCEIGSILTIVDALPPEGLTEESMALMYSQLMAAGMVILSKTQLTDAETANQTIAWLNQLIETEGGGRVLGDDVCVADWDALTDEDFIAFQRCGCRQVDHVRHTVNHGEIYGSFMTADRCLNGDDLRERLHRLMLEPQFGSVIRTKGYMRDTDKTWYAVNCTRREFSVAPAPNVKRGLLVVIGQNLNEEALKGLFIPREPRKK